MAQVSFYTAVDMTNPTSISMLSGGVLSHGWSAPASYFVYTNGTLSQSFSGVGYTYNGVPAASGGTINSISNYNNGALQWIVSSISMPVTTYNNYAGTNNKVGFFQAALAGADTINGSSGSDVLRGYAGNDTIYGNNGSDTIDGGAGDDVLYGGFDTASDTVSYATATAGVYVSLAITGGQQTVGAGMDTLSGFENIEGGNYGDTLSGDANANILWGGLGGDTLNGGGGDDYLEGGNGNDTLNGGAGFDWAFYGRNSAGVTVNLSLATAQNTVGAGVDTLSGMEGLWGGSGNDILIGSAGSNTIVGGLGNDVINGGAGNDCANYELSLSAVDVRLYLTSAQNTKGAGTDTLTNVENLYGSSYNDILMGNGLANMLNGGAGNNILVGLDGNDKLVGNLGNDKLDGGNGIDLAQYDVATAGVAVNLTLTSAQNTLGAGTDTLLGIENVSGSAFGDVLIGNGLANALAGLDGGDTLDGGLGNDILDGGLGNDTLMGGGGNDTLRGGDGNNTLDGGAGVDTVDYSSSGFYGVNVDLTIAGPQTVDWNNDTLIGIENLVGTTFGDTLIGNNGNNVLNGFGGWDTLSGGLGNDTLISDFADTLIGGGGADKFILQSTAQMGAVTIQDFQRGFDKIDLSAIDANANVAGNQAFTLVGYNPYGSLAAGQAWFAPNNVLVLNTTGGWSDYSVTLTGISVVGASDFIL